jgi:hypothetical protein
MYKTTRKVLGNTVMTCIDCGHAISMNDICQNPLQSATDMLKHMAAHKRSRAFALPEVSVDAELIPAVEPVVLTAADFQVVEPSAQSLN